MPANALGVVLLVGRQERPRRARLAEPAAHEHLRQRRAHAELAREARAPALGGQRRISKRRREYAAIA